MFVLLIAVLYLRVLRASVVISSFYHRGTEDTEFGLPCGYA
ncbi:hypothetical protein Barb6_01231 [Bacteroidales bacterium Barb6]|nr:hypothetical protein Barb6_01231 [Bacteroidales bacterium Barb6]